jgi:hypothetical protein
MNTIDELLATIKDTALASLKKEFKDFLTQAKKEQIGFVKETAERVEQWLLLYAQKRITKTELELLLDERRWTTRQNLNTLDISTRARLQKIVYGMIDIAVDSLIAAIKV